MPFTTVRFSTSQISIEFHDALKPDNISLVYAEPLAISLKLVRSEPPTAIELEALIESIENELMPILENLPKPRQLAAYRFELSAIVSASDATESVPSKLDLNTVERLFNRLARVANGTPAKHEGVPEDRGFAVRLVWLRELMHHGGYQSVTLI